MLIALEDLMKEYCDKVKGVIHIGAHLGEEVKVYKENKINQVIWIEGNPNLISPLKDNVSEYPNNFVYNLLASDSADQAIEFKITNGTQSSSIFELENHKIHHPKIKVSEVLSLTTKRMDQFINNSIHNISDFNFLNLDIQGAEYNALVGFGDLLKQVDYIYVEVNISPLYKDIKLLSDIDLYLSKFNFERKELSLTEYGWGDAFYVRQTELIDESRVDVLIKEAKDLEVAFKIKNDKNYLKKAKSFITRLTN